MPALPRRFVLPGAAVAVAAALIALTSFSRFGSSRASTSRAPTAPTAPTAAGAAPQQFSARGPRATAAGTGGLGGRAANASAGPRDFGFRGTTLQSRLAPPDPHLAAGPKHLVLITNEQIAFYTKDGRQTFAKNIIGGSGFWGALGNIPKMFDPEVHWDPHAKRFFAMAFGRSSPVNAGQSYFMVAVSDDQDPNGKWHLFRFDVTKLASVNNGGAGDIDSPNLGLDKDVLYLSADFQFGGAGRRHLIYMVEKAPLLSGKQPQKTASLLRLGTRHWGVPVVFGSAPAMYFLEQLAPFNGSATKIRLHAVTSPLSNPKLTSIDLTVPKYAWPGGVYAKGSSVRIAPSDPRFWGAPVWRDGSLWCCHHEGSPVKARWYEIKTNAWPTAGKPSIAQLGTVDLGSSVHTFFNAINVDANGNALMVFSVASPTDYISIGRAWRHRDDPKGTMRPAQIVQGNTAPYSVFRWGDYGAVTPDPIEPNAMWYAHEYAPVQNVWSTWVGKKVLAPLAADRQTLSEQGGTVELTLDNPSHQGRPYVLLVGASGTAPGFPWFGLRVPLNFDLVTQLGLQYANTSTLQDFVGVLDQDGMAAARLNAPALPGAAGIKLSFVYLQAGSTWDFVSNPVEVTIIK